MTNEKHSYMIDSTYSWSRKLKRGIYMKGSILSARRSACVQCGNTSFNTEENKLIGFKIPLCTKCGSVPDRMRVRKVIPGKDGSSITKDFQLGIDDKPITSIAQALALLGRINDELVKGTYRVEDYDARTKNDLKFKNFSESYIKWSEHRAKLPDTHKDAISKKTLDSKKNSVKHLQKFFQDIDIRDITKYKIREFERSWLDKFRSRDLALGELKTILKKFAREELGVLDIVPVFPKINRARELQPSEIPTALEQAKIINNISVELYRDAWTIGAVYAKRPCEIRALKVCDVNLAERTLTTRRHFSGNQLRSGRKSIRETSDHGTVVDHLDDYSCFLLLKYVTDRDPDEFLFENRLFKGRDIKETTFTDAWYKACNRVGLKYKPYAGTKHATLTNLLEETNGNFSILKEFSAHTNVVTLQRYAKPRKEKKARFVDSARFN